MHIILSGTRIATMRKRLGKASQIIKNDNFLPFYRNRQIAHEEEFEQSVKLSLKKKNPERYLATIWAKKNILKSLEWLRKMVRKAKEALFEKQRQAKQNEQEERFNKEYNAKGRASIESLYAKFGMFRA